MPREYAHELDKNEMAKKVFETLSKSKQKEILAYLNWIKRPETLKRNIEKIVAKLEKQWNRNLDD